ncbi:glutamate--cysteine ligase [Pseudomonas mangiferae]|uniref:Glutamate--cysteine ligase n=1 Tax=Pseudomonas mangiferae TaxID=2593654 RepID=A0A553H096_9PSED|nr:glutamate--cysteine ligase [Pseudomonas mangiferae]TRX75160.1 glutamate--cysteine ligase [Pseudomonas mangiferae]
MSDLLSRRLAVLGERANLSLLGQCLHGIERECLRVDAQGQLALTDHPVALGAALTHPQITTDYSEALLEFITATDTDVTRTLDELEKVHRFTYGRLEGELLWSPSMPCRLPPEELIPIARYGSSNIGRLKHVYRRGLAVRYGKTMQCIAGIHYNFSLPEAIWPLLQALEGDSQAPRDYQSARYIAMIRNFRRYSWLLMYLFGATPALDVNFLRGRPHQLDSLDADTLYLPWATSLRMSDLGYQNNAQSGLTPCYNGLDSYLDSLRQAVSTPYPPYAAIGTKRNGEWVQLNTNMIQIENEYYSSIRPKRVTYTGERPLQALMARGVQYVEVRCLDIDPYLPVGIDLDEARFLDAFLLYCALQDSPPMDGGECRASTDNFQLTVKEGRRPGLQLQRRGQPVGLRDWAGELLENIGALSELLDTVHGGDAHRRALDAQRSKVEDPERTPSARVLADLRASGDSFTRFALRQSRAHAEHFRREPLAAADRQRFEALVQQSLGEQAELEAADQGDFDTFVAAYQASILGLLSV